LGRRRGALNHFADGLQRGSSGHRRQWPAIPDQHVFGAGLSGRCQDRRHVARPGHAGFIDRDHCRQIEGMSHAHRMVTSPLSDSPCRDAGGAREFIGRYPAWSQANDPKVGFLCGVDEGARKRFRRRLR